MKADAASSSLPRKGKGKGSGGFSAGSRGSRSSCVSRGKMKTSESKQEKKRKLILSDSDEEKRSPRRKCGNVSGNRKAKMACSLEIKEESASNGRRTAGAGLDGKRQKMDSLRAKEDRAIDRRRAKAETLRGRVGEADYLDPYAYRDDDEFDRRLIMNSGRDMKKTGIGSFKCNHDGDTDSRKTKINSLKRKVRKADFSDLTVDRCDDDTDRKGNSSSRNLKKRKLANSVGTGGGSDVKTRNLKIESRKSKEDKSDGRESWDLGSRLVSPTSRQREREMESGSTSRVNKKGTRNGVSTLETKRKTDGSDKKRINVEKADDPYDTVAEAKGKNGVSKLFSKEKVKAGNCVNREGKAVDDDGINNYGSTNICRKAAVSSSFSGEKVYERRGSSAVMLKNHPKKVLLLDENKEDDVRKVGSTRTVKMRSKSKDSSNIKTEDTVKQERISPLRSPSAVEQNDKSQKMGRAAEKQLLREQIKDMLVNAGWKIDCRQRMSRNYMDFVYIAPSGREYWSIVKAYNAFQKQYLENEEDAGAQNLDDRKSLLPVIPVEALGILKRKTNNDAKKLTKSVNKKKLKIDKVGKKPKLESKIKLGKNKYIKGSIGRHMKQEGKLVNKPGVRDREQNSSGSMLKEELELIGPEKPCLTSKAKLVQGTNQIRQRGCSLLARSSNEGANIDADELAAFAGKRTVLSWLIDSGTVPENGKVQYMNKRRTRPMLKGLITSDGINCSCCSKILSVSDFEIHAGSQLCQPLQNIILESGISLLQCQLDAWNKQEELERIGFHFIDPSGDDPNDDTCGICGDGGDLICCDGCPSTFHLRCLNIEMLPPDDWHCPNCLCKYCGSVDGHPQGESLSLLSCSQCEEKYHHACMQETDVPEEPDGESRPFCVHSCGKIFSHLRKLLGLRNELEAGFSWTILQRFDEVSGTSGDGLEQKVDCNSKLAVAFAVMDECFFPITDRRTGFNLIRHVLYNFGSNFNRLNYSGFYTFVLERGEEIISVASIRIHGTRLAEMPFIGTRHRYRRQGMCRRLLNAIESALCSLGVEKLIIPAISELMHTWTTIFNFMPLEDAHRRELRSMNLVVFPGTDMLQKPLLETVSTKGKTNASATLGASEVKSNNPDAPNDSHVASSVGPVSNSSDEGEDGDTSMKSHLHACCDSPSDPSVAPIGSSLDANGTAFSDSKPQGDSSEVAMSVTSATHMDATHQHDPHEENPSTVVFPGAEALKVQSKHHDASSVGSPIHSCNGVEDEVATELDLHSCHNSPVDPDDHSIACKLQHNGPVCSESKPQDKSLEALDGAFILHRDAGDQGNPDDKNLSPVAFPVTEMLQEPSKKNVSAEGEVDVTVGSVIDSSDEVEVAAAEPDQQACCNDSQFGSSDACIESHLQANGIECSDFAPQDQSSKPADGNCPHLASDEDGESSKAAAGLNSGSFVKERGSEFLGSCEDPSDKSCVTHSDVVYSDAPQVVKETPVSVVAASECNHCNGAVPYTDKIANRRELRFVQTR